MLDLTVSGRVVSGEVLAGAEIPVGRVEIEGGELYITLHRLHSNNSSFRWAAIIVLLLFHCGVNCEGQSHKTVSTVWKRGVKICSRNDC